MNSFLQLPAVRRRLAFQQVDAEKGLQALRFFGETPTFEAILEEVREFERRFNETNRGA